MTQFPLFLQFEGDERVELVSFPDTVDVAQVRAKATELGFDHLVDALVFAEGDDEPLDERRPLRDQKVGPKHRVHLHRCRQIQVTLHFVDVTKHHPFSPATTVAQVKKWFVDKIGMSPTDATEHVLQITGTTRRPSPDTHIGSLVRGRCAIEFSLVPIKRIEG